MSLVVSGKTTMVGMSQKTCLTTNYYLQDDGEGSKWLSSGFANYSENEVESKPDFLYFATSNGRILTKDPAFFMDLKHFGDK